jgi:hypothetical protein
MTGTPTSLLEQQRVDYWPLTAVASLIRLQ